MDKVYFIFKKTNYVIIYNNKIEYILKYYYKNMLLE